MNKAPSNMVAVRNLVYRVDAARLLDRVSLKCTLEPLDVSETRQMIEFRLREAGYRSRLELFTDDAIEAIYDYSEGYPRRIAMLCHQTLRTLVMCKGRLIDAGLVEGLVQKEVEAGWSQPRRLQKSSSSI